MMAPMTSHELLLLGTAYAAAAGISLATAGKRVCGNVYIFRRLAAGRGCNSRTLDLATAFFAVNWPDGALWPEGVTDIRTDTEDATEDNA